MANIIQKGLKFPKVDFQKKANGQTSFYSTTETFQLPASANWNGNTLFAVQLDHLPALAREAIGQIGVLDPIITCTDDSSTRVLNLKRPDSGVPAVGEVYLDIYNGIIQFNPADASANFSVAYYVKGDLIDHNAMNRIWSAGTSYIVGSQQYADYATLDDLIAANVLVDYDSVKLMDDQTTSGITINTKIKIVGNNRKIIKSGSIPSARAIIFNEDIICEDVDFQGWDETGDICLFANADVRAIITKNKNIGGTQLTNASLVCSYCIVENNLPFSENVGQATTLIDIYTTDKVVKQFVANGAVSVNDPIFLDLADPTKCKKLATVSDADIFLGFALNNAADGVNVNVCVDGIMSGLSGLTANNLYFIKANGTLGTLSAGNKPLPAFYPNFSSNQILGTSGESFHSYVGKAISASEIIMTKKRENNLTRISGSGSFDGGSSTYMGFDMFSTRSISPGTTQIQNVFIDEYGINYQNFDTSKQPWELVVEGILKLQGFSSTGNLPEISMHLHQFDTGTTNERFIERVFLFLQGSGTYNSSIPFRAVFKNTNPGSGQVRVRYQASAGSGTVSGSIGFTITKVDLKFL